MKSYLTRIVFIGCLQIILSTGVALATDDKIAEIIRSKVEQITSEAELQIQGAQIASATVLPEVYEENGFKQLWSRFTNNSLDYMVQQNFNGIWILRYLLP